jgi:hypothetical protein
MTLNTKGDWASPISIRYTIDPVKIKGQALQLRRTVSIVAAHCDLKQKMASGGSKRWRGL